MVDYHLHTRLCRHATGEMAEYIEAAAAKGIKEVCFTPHIPMPDFYGRNLRMEPADMDIYLAEIDKLKKEYPNMVILTGLEADYYEGYEEYLENFLSSYSFDLVLISIHFIAGWPQGNWVFNFDFPGRPLSHIYHDYFQALKRGINTGLFDIVAHFDLIKQPGAPVLETNREDVEEIIDLCSRKGVGFEINTSGFRKAIGEPYPAPEIIEILVDKGLLLISGSDAHAPEQVALRFDTLQPIPITRFKKRRPLKQ